MRFAADLLLPIVLSVWLFYMLGPIVDSVAGSVCLGWWGRAGHGYARPSGVPASFASGG